MTNSLSSALLALDSEALKNLLDETLETCDLTLGRSDGLKRVTLTDRRDKLTIVAYRETSIEALSFVLEVWHNIQSVEVTAALLPLQEQIFEAA